MLRCFGNHSIHVHTFSYHYDLTMTTMPMMIQRGYDTLVICNMHTIQTQTLITAKSPPLWFHLTYHSLLPNDYISVFLRSGVLQITIQHFNLAIVHSSITVGTIVVDDQSARAF